MLQEILWLDSEDTIIIRGTGMQMGFMDLIYHGNKTVT